MCQSLVWFCIKSPEGVLVVTSSHTDKLLFFFFNTVGLLTTTVLTSPLALT